MKRQAPPKQIRDLLTVLSNQYRFSTQTYFNAIQILMSPLLPEMCNHDPDVAIASLFISHKLHDVHLQPLADLCPPQIDPNAVLQMEGVILAALKFKVSFPLLLDISLQLAAKWDSFMEGISCINTRFHSTSNIQYLSQLVQKIIYAPKSIKREKTKLAAAAIFCTVYRKERRQNNKCFFKGEKSTEIILADFILEEAHFEIQDIAAEIKFINQLESRGRVLKEITNSVKAQPQKYSKANQSLVQTNAVSVIMKKKPRVRRDG